MAVTSNPLINAKFAENFQTTQFISTSQRTIIDKFTATNNSVSAVSFTINLVQTGSSAGASNVILSARSIAPGECYTCPEVVGHVLSPSDFISTLASTTGALVIRASGRAIT